MIVAVDRSTGQLRSLVGQVRLILLWKHSIRHMLDGKL